MGIIVILILIFLVGLTGSISLFMDDNDPKSFIIMLPTIIVMLFFFVFTVIIPIDGDITNAEYIKALGAKNYIETVEPAQENITILADAYKTLEHYQSKRDKIEKKHDSLWSGVFYDYKDLQTYPEIKINK